MLKWMTDSDTNLTCLETSLEQTIVRLVSLSVIHFNIFFNKYNLYKASSLFVGKSFFIYFYFDGNYCGMKATLETRGWGCI